MISFYVLRGVDSKYLRILEEGGNNVNNYNINIGSSVNSSSC